MRRSVKVLCRPAVSSGFALTSLPVTEVDDADQAARRIDEMGDDPETGVILMEDSLYEALPDETVRSLAARPLPMIVPFPGPVWVERPAPEEYVVELLRRAIGYRVRLR